MDFEDIYSLYFKEVYSYMRSICRDEALCEEIAQETFFKALKKIGSFDGRKDIRAWLFTIAKNTYISYLRKSKRFTDPDAVVNAPDEDPNLEDKLSESESIYQIHTILHRLREPYKEVFSLRVFGELDYEHIGRLFGKSAGWARVTYYRAKTMIQYEMEDKNE